MSEQPLTATHIAQSHPNTFVCLKQPHQTERLTSGCPSLDDGLAGGLPYGSLIEIGAPFGFQARTVLLKYLAQASRNRTLSLWVNGYKEFSVFPPAWFCHGINPELLVFADSEKPTQELHRVFLQRTFKVIALDLKARPSPIECAFLAKQARYNQQLIAIVYNRYLTNNKGNSHSRLRFNISAQKDGTGFYLHVIRGLSERILFVSQKEIKQSTLVGQIYD